MSSIFKNRLNNLYNNIAKHDLDGLYITNLTNIRYLTGFTGSAAILIVLKESSYFLLMVDIYSNRKSKLITLM